MNSKSFEQMYLELIRKILNFGYKKPTRQGGYTLALFGETLKYDLRNGFPAITTKVLAFFTMLAEVIWILTGSSSEPYLERLGSTVWKKDLNSEPWQGKGRFPGDLGLIYGPQARYHSMSAVVFIEKLKEKLENEDKESLSKEESLGLLLDKLKTIAMDDNFKVDQVKNVLDGLENNPFSRRYIVDMWNPSELHKMSVTPCHAFYHFSADPEGGLHLEMTQRSGDVGLGVVFNAAMCGMFLSLFAKALGMEPRTVTHHINDAHIYEQHIDQLKKQIERTPKKSPELVLSDEITKDFIINLKGDESLTKSDVKELASLEGYDPHPHIKMPLITQ